MKSIRWLLLLVPLLPGCREAAAVLPEPKAEPSLLASRFDPANTGRIEGHVVWDGAIPTVESLVQQPFRVGLPPAIPEKRRFPNPHAPAIDPRSRGVGQAVVFLRGVDPARSRPWYHDPVTVAMRDDQLLIQQGEAEGRIGFVQRGQSIVIVSRQKAFHLLNAEGAAFFGLAFPEPDRPLSRKLDKAGHVELTSGAACFWMRGHLFVTDHPYCCLTDSAGRFLLDQVPVGTYELVAWLPNWHEADRHYNPETAEVTRLYFRPAVELRQQVTVQSGQPGPCSFRFAGEMFAATR